MTNENPDGMIDMPDMKNRPWIIALSVISLIMNTISFVLIVSNTIRLLSRKRFKLLIFLFYLFALLAVIATMTLYTLIIGWCLF